MSTNSIEEQNRKCIVSELGKNIFVEAGAGAGKTTLIVERIINQLKTGISPNEIVVITFTNAAAEELRGRITSKVHLATMDSSLSDEEKNRLCEAESYLDLMNISTIHSFCYKLLQERVFDIGLPMDFTLSQEEETGLIHKKFISQWISMLNTSEWDELLSQGQDKDRAKISRTIEGVFEDICELPDSTKIINDMNLQNNSLNAARILAEDFEQELCSAIGQVLGKTFSEIVDVPDNNLSTQGKKIKGYFAENPVNYYGILGEVIRESNNKNKYLKGKKAELAKGLSLEDVGKYDKRCRAWGEEIHADEIYDVLKQIEANKYNLYISYAVRARDAYRKERTGKTVSNDDLLQKTHKLICESQEARRYFAGKYKCIYVDEFQDTDNIQEEFIWKLAMKEDGSGLRDGALFLVGDPKQSIYRFRGAQPEVYFKAKEKMSKLDNGNVYCLDYNFRSNEKIIDWVNTEFARKNICAQQGYRNMVSKAELPKEGTLSKKISDKLLAGVYYYKNPKDGGIKIEDDALSLSRLIYNLVNGDYYICDYDKDKKTFTRRIKYSDFLVLCYSQLEMNMYLKAMNKIGIPVSLYGKIPLGVNRALISFARLFDFLTHPYDRLKRAGAIECLEKNNVYDERVLSWFIEETKDMSGAGIAGFLCGSLELLVPHNIKIDKNQISSVQKKVYQMVESVLHEQDSTGKPLSEGFWNYSKKIIDRELSLDYDGDEVRFMNAHKAKGLEGNIVILVKRKESMSFKEGPYRKGDEYYPACSDGYRCAWSAYRDIPGVFAQAKVEDEQEKTRLEYVVATRAKQAFIIMDAIKPDTIFSQYSIVQENNSVESIVDDGNVVAYVSPPEIASDSYSIAIVPKVCANGRLQNEPVYSACKPSDFEETSKLRAQAKKELLDKGISLKLGRRPKGNIFGDAMHRSLELMINRWVANDITDVSYDAKNIQVSVGQTLNERTDILSEADVVLYSEYLIKILECFVKWARASKVFEGAQGVYTELPFSYYEEGENSVWMNGAIDLIVKDKDGKFTVYDYKSDRDINYTKEVFVESLKEQYSGQLRQYRHAVGRLFDVGEDEIGLRIVSFMGDVDIEVEIVEVE